MFKPNSTPLKECVRMSERNSTCHYFHEFPRGAQLCVLLIFATFVSQMKRRVVIDKNNPHAPLDRKMTTLSSERTKLYTTCRERIEMVGQATIGLDDGHEVEKDVRKVEYARVH